MLITSLTTKINGAGIFFKDYFHKSSALFSAVFYDWDSIMKPNTALKPKDINSLSTMLDDGYTIRWIDSDIRRKSSLLDGIVAAAATELTVDDGTVFHVGDSIFLAAYGQTHVVTAIAGNDLTVSPAVPAGGYADDSKVRVVSSAIDTEGSVDGKPVTVEIGSETTNFIQHVSKSVSFKQEDLNKIMLKYTDAGISKDKAANMYVKETLEKGLREVQNDFVNAFFVGTKRAETIGGNTYRYTAGINSFVDETIDCTGSDSKEQLQKIIDALDAMQSVQATDGMYANVLLCTRRAASRIALMAAGNYEITENISLDKIGMRIKVIKTTYGDIPLYIDPLMTELFDDANIAYTFNPKMVSIVSTNNLPANLQKGESDMTGLTSLSGVKFFKNETAVKQPNSSALINLYTNFGFMFQGASVGMYKKLINLGE